MKTPPEPDDELLKTFIVETNALPQMAAAQARRQRQKRSNIIRVVAAVMFLLFPAGIWFSKQVSNGDVEKNIAISDVKPSEPAKPLPQQGYVKVYQVGETVEPSVPPDVSEREKKLLTELPDVPLLIVKNDAGEIARIHIFER